MDRNRTYALIAFLGLALILIGVRFFSRGDNGGRVGVSGTVNHAGSPLPAGRIQLRPAEGTSGPVAWGTIEEGRFHIDPEFGPRAGTYRVNVVLGAAPSKKDVMRSPDPHQSGTPSQRTISVAEVFTIPAGSARNTLNLDLPP